MSETVIVAALKRGNLRRAVELILDTYQDDVYGYCASHVGRSRSAAVYQEVLVTALSELAGYREGVSVRAWLYGVARRVVRQAQAAAPSSDEAAAPDVEDAPPGRVLAEDPELDSCLMGLEPAMREVLQLSLWHGLRLVEIAHITALSPVEVRALAARGLTALAADLQHLEGVPA